MSRIGQGWKPVVSFTNTYDAEHAQLVVVMSGAQHAWSVVGAEQLRGSPLAGTRVATLGPFADPSAAMAAAEAFAAEWCAQFAKGSSP